MKARQFWIPAIVVALMAAPAALYAQTPMGTAFTYQGQLNKAGLPVNGTADFEFTLWDAPSGGNQVGPMVPVNNMPVDNGLFTVVLDFGSGIFTGEARWLEIAVRVPAGSGSFTTLSPRQELTPTAYALYAASSPPDADWTISGNNIYRTVGKVGIGTTPSDSKLHVLTSSGGGEAGYFQINNTGNSASALYAETNGDFGASVYGSHVSKGCVGYLGGFMYGVYGYHGPSSTFGYLGGADHRGVFGYSQSGVGVYGNTDSGEGVFGFSYNGIAVHGKHQSGNYGYLGTSNYGVKGYSSSGHAGYFEGDVKVAGTGKGIIFPDGTKQTTAATGAVLTLPYAGTTSTAGNAFSITNNGSGNAIYGEASAGYAGYFKGKGYFGGDLRVTGKATIGPGHNNTGADGFVAGNSSTASGDWSTVGGGHSNSASGDYSTVGGGGGNTASRVCATVGGGAGNTANDNNATVGGGMHNTASQYCSTVGGGYENTASGGYSTVSGGSKNTASGVLSAIGGGYDNHNAGEESVIPGGSTNTLTVEAERSMVFGYRVYVSSSYRVVFFDGTYDGRLGINRDDYDGGVGYPIHVGTNSSNGNGAHLTEGGAWTDGSGDGFKESFQPLDGEQLLTEISSLDIEAWEYKNSSERHIGPYSEDFVRAFDVGTVREDGGRENQYLAASDVAGVALAGVKELAQRNQELRQIIADLREQNAMLEARLAAIERVIGDLANTQHGGAE